MESNKNYSTIFEFEYWTHGSDSKDAARKSAEKFIDDINRFGVDFLLDFSKTYEIDEDGNRI